MAKSDKFWAGRPQGAPRGVDAAVERVVRRAEPRDGTPRGRVALAMEDRAVRVLNEAERQIDAAYQDGYIAGYLARAEDEDEKRPGPLTDPADIDNWARVQSNAQMFGFKVRRL